MTGIDISSELGRKLVAVQGRIESGYLANERTLRSYVPIHVRVRGDRRTLCGKDVSGDLRFYWCSMGEFATSLPSYLGRNGCKTCVKHPIVTLTADAEKARRLAWATRGRTNSRQRERGRG